MIRHWDPRTVTTPLEHAIQRAQSHWPVNVSLSPLIGLLHYEASQLEKLQRHRDSQAQPSLLNTNDSASQDASGTVQ